MESAELKPFTLEEPSIEEIASRLAQIYAPVSLSRHPMFSWLLIMDDVTILGEDLRRQREDEAIYRAFAVLVRLLEFVGHYTYVHALPDDGRLRSASDVVARMLRRPSYTRYVPDSLREGPTRWILVKYPFACSKCGRDQCQCLLAPWVLENRREEPEEYVRRFQSQAEEARKHLKDRPLLEFTLKSLVDHFDAIYKANYYHQDQWKIGMHLSEEMGEATIELCRMELRWRVHDANFDVKPEIPDIVRVATDKIDRQTKKITEKGGEQERYRTRTGAHLQEVLTALRRDPLALYEELVAEKFKEEVADVLSWLIAIVVKLDPGLRRFKAYPNRFAREGRGGVRSLACPWCTKFPCSDGCLVSHAISSEIAEKVSRF